MARNGSGTYVLPAGQPVVTLTTISSSTHNTLATDLANALTTSVATDGQSAMTGNLNLGSNKITSLATGTASTDATNLTQMQTAITNAKTAVMGRNYLDNGGMTIAQAATSVALTTSATYGSIDRWFCSMAATAAGVWARQALTSSSRPYQGQLKRTAASTSTGTLYIGQIIESQKSLELAGQTVILSFKAAAGANFSAASSNITVKIHTGTGTDQGRASMVAGTWTGAATPLNSTQAITTTLTKYTFSVAIPSTVTEIGVQILWTPVGTAGADDALYITEAQLEKSLNGDTTASTFECDSPAVELARCQRYFQQVVLAVIGYNSAAANLSASVNFPVAMRSTPGAAQVTNNYAFTSANSTGTTTTYTFIDTRSITGYRAVTALGSSQWSELTNVSADL